MHRLAWTGVVALSLLASCSRAPVDAPTPTNRYLRLPRRTRQYTTVWNADSPAARSSRTTEAWGEPVTQGGLTLRTIESREVAAGQPDRVDRMRVFVDRGAFGFYATVGPDGTEDRYDPPQVVLPAQPRLGQRWAATHRTRAESVRRTCELIPFAGCPGGMSADCHSQRAELTTHVVEHFCPGVGWIGEDAAVFNTNGRYATAIGAVIVDGEPVARSQDRRAPLGP